MPAGEAVSFEWRGLVHDGELAALHRVCFGGDGGAAVWCARLERFSLGWVVARAVPGNLVGFLNVAWDGGAHAFVLDTMVAPDRRRDGLATRLVAEATMRSRAAGCEWLHVDFAAALAPFYLDACGFAPTAAGVVRLR